jgi:hypothetical protein
MSYRVTPIDAIARVDAVAATHEGPTLNFEARVLAARPSRAGRAPRPSSDRRRAAGGAVDPPGSRVLVLIIPNGAQLPADVQKPGHRVFLRFAKPG